MPSRRQVLTTVGALSAGSAAGCLGESDAEATAESGDGTTDWPMVNFDTAASGYNPKPVGPAEKPTERWNVEVGWPTGRPVVADGTVYLPTQSHLRAIDVESGDERWNRGPTDSTDAPGYTSPAVDDGTVYVGVSRGGGLLALDAEDGSQRWRYETGDERTGVDVPPIPDYVGDGGWSSLVVASDDGVVHHLDLETQEANWTFEVYGRVSRLVSRGNVVYAGTEGGEVYALHAGEGLWRRKLPGKITALATDDGGDVFASTFGGGVFRLRDGAHAGRTRWHAEDGPVAHEAFVIARGRVCGTDLADATVLDERSGDVQWEVDGDFGVPPAGAGDTLYLGGEDGIVAYRLDGGFGVDDVRFGGKRWHYPFDGSVGGGVTVADGAVFAVDTGSEDESSRLVALE